MSNSDPAAPYGLRASYDLPADAPARKQAAATPYDLPAETVVRGPYGLPAQSDVSDPYDLAAESQASAPAGATAQSPPGPGAAAAEIRPMPGAAACALRSAGPLRVVHVGPCFTRGGAEQQLIDLTRFLNPQRLHVAKCVATTPSLVDPCVVADMPAPVEVGDDEAVRRAVDEHDVVFCWGLKMDAILGPHRPKLGIFLAHGDSWWTRALLDGSSRSVDHVIAVSRRVQDQVCNGHPTTVIHNGIDSSRLGQTRSRQEVRSSLGFSPDDFVLGYVGRFSSEKRPDVMIHAAARLPRHFKTLFVGWGPLRTEMIDLANQLIPGRFAFVSANSHLGDYYQSLDAMCLLSSSEGFALVVLEALMCGRPVIATPVGSVPELVVDRVNGLIVDGDAASVSAAVQLLHDHPHWAQAIGLEGRRYAEQHGHAWRMARQYEDLVERLWTEKYGSP